jgi:hypothetical protein
MQEHSSDYWHAARMMTAFHQHKSANPNQYGAYAGVRADID